MRPPRRLVSLLALTAIALMGLAAASGGLQVTSSAQIKINGSSACT
jgi:hypothetical protein